MKNKKKLSHIYLNSKTTPTTPSTPSKLWVVRGSIGIILFFEFYII